MITITTTMIITLIPTIIIPTATHPIITITILTLATMEDITRLLIIFTILAMVMELVTTAERTTIVQPPITIIGECDSKCLKGLDIRIQKCYTINMFKMNKKSIVFALAILGFLTFSFNQADAYSTYWGGTPVDMTYRPQVYNNPTPASNPAPVIKSIDPSSSPKGLGTKTITITGSGFVPSSVARMNGFDRNTIFIDSSTLLMKLAEGDLY